MPLYRGSCHCGSIMFEVDTLIDKITECNCSICYKKGILHHRIRPEQIRFISTNNLATYQFGTLQAKHHFCHVCGIHVFTRPRAAPDMYTVNVRVLENIDQAFIQEKIIYFDGANWEESVADLHKQLAAE